jgi:uncharacterized protein YjbI with pentapeptide repeats
MNVNQLNADNLDQWWPQMGSEVTIGTQLLVRENITGIPYRFGALALTMTAVLLYMMKAAERADWDMDDSALHRALAGRLEGYARQTELSIFGVMPREAEVQKAKNTTVASFVVTAKQLAKPHDSRLDSVVAMTTLCEKVINSIQAVGSPDAQFVVDLIRYRQTNIATKALTRRLVHPAFYYLDLYGPEGIRMADMSDDTELDAEDDEIKPWERPFDVRPGGSAAGLDLSGMELGGDLSGIDFRKAILGGWDPVDEDETYGPGGIPDVQYTDFSGANLTGANFSGQDLSGLLFVGAVLQGANLSRCSLGADFTDADLSGANLRGASGIDEGDFSGAIVDDIKGLSAENRELLEELV